MNTPFETPKAAPAATKSLWAAVGVLGVAVLALGASLVYIQTRPPEPRLALIAPPVSAPAPLGVASAAPAVAVLPAPVVAPAVVPSTAPASMPKKAAVPAQRSHTATKSVAQSPARRAVTTPPAPDGYTGNGPTVTSTAPAAPVFKPICANCGTVSAVTPIQRDGTGSGGGAIAGGVLGAVVGNQVGDGGGKALATILGAVGGGFAGNAVEKKMKKETVYEVQVQMEDGNTRRFEQTTPTAVGAKVLVEGNTLHPASR